MNGTNPKVDHFLAHAKSWQQELAQLRAIILDCKLTEELKWGMPCYTLGGANVVLVHVCLAQRGDGGGEVGPEGEFQVDRSVRHA